MAIIQLLTGNQIRNYTLTKDDINTSIPGQALITKVIAGNGVSTTSTGVDEGTGDVTISTESITLGPPTTNNTANGTILNMNVSSNSFGFGACMCLDATAYILVEATASNEDRVPAMGLALETGTGSKNILLNGLIRHDLWAWTPNKTLYVSTTSGAITQTRPNGLNETVQEIGFALTPTIIMFNPDKTYFKLK